MYNLFLSSIAICLAMPMKADGFGSVTGSQVIDSATVCFQIGLQAALTGLDDLILEPVGASGAAGTVYVASDSFHLESNDAVRVLIEGVNLQQGLHTIDTEFLVDGVKEFYDTEPGQPHQADHEFKVIATLGAISSQLSGHYQTLATLTVIPLLGGPGGCGESTLTLPGDADTNYTTIAFEDLYPSSGDADYNDFVVRYSVEEHYDAKGNLETVSLDFIPLARGTEFNHALMLDLNGTIERTRTAVSQTEAPFIGNANVTVTYTDLNNGTTRTKHYSADDDIPNFHNTRSTLAGYANVYADEEFIEPNIQTSVQISLASPELNRLPDDHEIATDKYRVFLNVMTTNSDIDLAVVNPDDGMIDANGYPFGIVVPGNWAWMLEQHGIEEAYPYFEEYRRYLRGEIDELSAEAANWFRAIDTSSDVTVDLEELEQFLGGTN